MGLAALRLYPVSSYDEKYQKIKVCDQTLRIGRHGVFAVRLRSVLNLGLSPPPAILDERRPKMARYPISFCPSLTLLTVCFLSPAWAQVDGPLDLEPPIPIRGEPSDKTLKAWQEELEKKLLAEVEPVIKEYEKRIRESTVSDARAVAMKKQLAERRETLDHLARVYWKEFKSGKRSVQQVIEATRQLVAGELDSTELHGKRVLFREKHVRQLEMMEAELKKRLDANETLRGDYLACKAARQLAEIEWARERLIAAPKREQNRLEVRVKAAFADYRLAAAKHRAAVRGGSSMALSTAGLAWHRDNAALGIARGDLEMALRETNLACAYAHRKAKAVEAMIAAGVLRGGNGVILQTQVEREELLADLLRLKRRVVGTPEESAEADKRPPAPERAPQAETAPRFDISP